MTNYDAELVESCNGQNITNITFELDFLPFWKREIYSHAPIQLAILASIVNIIS